MLAVCLDAYTRQVALLDTFMRALAAEALRQADRHIAEGPGLSPWSYPIERPDEVWDAFWRQWERMPRLGLAREAVPRNDLIVGWRGHKLSTFRVAFGLRVIHEHPDLICQEHILAEEDGLVAIPLAMADDERDHALYPAAILAHIRRALVSL